MLFLSDIQKIIIERIKFGANGLTNKTIARNIVRFWRGSEKIRDMEIAKEYHLVKNATIADKNRDHIKPIALPDGTWSEERVKNSYLTNTQIKSAFPRTSVEQKINYGFNNPFILEVLQKDTVADEESAELEVYRDEWIRFLDERTRNCIKRIVTDSIVSGISYAYVTINDLGALVISDVEPATIYPGWADRAHEDLDAIVRDYAIVVYTDSAPEVIRKVEYWDRDMVEFYIDDGGDWQIDNDAEAFVIGGNDRPTEGGIPHLKTIGWGKVPFVPLKANSDELPFINMIKSYIDAIDYLKSKSVDTLMDDMDAILILRGVAPELVGLLRSRVNIKNSGIMATDSDGGAEYVKNDPNVDATIKTIESLYKDILQYSSTVDTKETKFDTTMSGVAVKMQYQPIDIYLNGLESQFRAFMNEIKYYFDMSLELRGVGTREDFAEYTIKVTLDRDMMINESEIIDNIMKLGSELSQETRDKQNPYVTDHDTEQKRRDLEKEKIIGDKNDFRKLIEAEMAAREVDLTSLSQV